MNVAIDKQLGLTVDIFPLVSCGKEDSLHTVRKIQRWIRIKRKVYANGGGSMVKKLLKSFMSAVFPISPKGVCDKIMKLTDTITPGDYYVIPMDPNYSNRYFPKDWFEPFTRYDFGDGNFYGVTQYDSYLKMIYNDYMKLPPENKRRTHIIDTFIK